MFYYIGFLITDEDTTTWKDTFVVVEGEGLSDRETWPTHSGETLGLFQNPNLLAFHLGA